MARIEYQKNHKLSTKWMIGGLLAAFVLVASSILLLLYPFASKDKKNYFQGKNPILFNGHQMGNALLEGNTMFVPVSFLQKNIDKGIIYDTKSQSIIITTADKVVQMPTDSLTYFVNQKPVNLHITPFKSQNGEMYVALDSILSYYPIQYKKLANSDAIWIQKNGEKLVKGNLTSNDVNLEKLRLRTKPTWQAPYTADMKPSEPVYIEGQKADFYLVRNMSGISGYIKKEYVQKHAAETIKVSHKSTQTHIKKITGPIQLTWEAVNNHNPDTSQIPKMAGLNVVSPTWFTLAGNDGTISNHASLDYSKWAKSKGYQVWGLFSNAFNPDLTHAALKDYQTRQKIIRQLLLFSKMYQLQGINFDIENVKPEDGALVTQLIREATPYLHQAGLVVSMDITFSFGQGNSWSSFYQRNDLAKITDYLIVMAYDEHWGPGSGSGSVASLPWVETNLQKLLTEVPKDHLILGVPLYTRLWKEQVNKAGSLVVTTKALSMDNVKDWLKEKKIKPVYDPKSGQHFAKYYDKKEKATYKIWIEDELSLTKRKNLAETYQLAGIGAWSRFFANANAWTALDLNTDKAVTKK